MSIKPIDLQTLFMHMNQVGKEQAQQKEGLHLQQLAMGSELVKETEQRDKSVNETESTSDGPEEVHEDQEQSQGGKKKRKKEEEETQNEKSSRKYYSDPDLGKNIDISG